MYKLYLSANANLRHIMWATVSDEDRRHKPARAAFSGNIYPGIYAHTVIINGNRRRFLWEIPKTRSNLDAKRQVIIVARLPTAWLAYGTIGDATGCIYASSLTAFPTRKRKFFRELLLSEWRFTQINLYISITLKTINNNKNRTKWLERQYSIL